MLFLITSLFPGSLLLEELVTAYEDYGIDSILEAAQMRFHESRELKQAGSADWWRVSF
jgi:importin-9